MDAVIQDYEVFTSEIQKLQADNEKLRSRVDELTKQVSVGGNSQTARPQTNMTNMDVLKRLSNLERHVFGAQLNDNGDQGNRF